MTRPADQLPRVIMHEGKIVYAPWCDRCESDKHTRWSLLPTLERLQQALYSSPSADALCLRCESVVYVDRVDAYLAREPERLEARLAELRAGARRSA